MEWTEEQKAQVLLVLEAIAEKHHGNFGLVHDAVLCYNENADRYECPWCYGHQVGKDFQHEEDCPVTIARNLLIALNK